MKISDLVSLTEGIVQLGHGQRGPGQYEIVETSVMPIATSDQDIMLSEETVAQEKLQPSSMMEVQVHLEV